jgi:formiminotetrahydrofolate cyclodeaminase
MGQVKTMVRKESIEAFLQRLASSAPTPGGGGAAALSGALGCALGRMVANLTAGRKKYASVEEEMRAADRKLAEIEEELLKLADQDETVFLFYMEAVKMPKETEDQKMKRDRSVRLALTAATKNSLDIMLQAGMALHTVAYAAEAGNKNAVSDAGAAVNMLLGAVETGAENVRINLASMKDEQEKAEFETKMYDLLEAGRQMAERIRKTVRSRISADMPLYPAMGARYYRLAGSIMCKIDKDRNTMYILDRETGTWREDGSLYAEYLHGELHGHFMVFDDHYGIGEPWKYVPRKNDSEEE